MRPLRRTHGCCRQRRQARQGGSAAALAGGPSGRHPAQRWHLPRVPGRALRSATQCSGCAPQPAQAVTARHARLEHGAIAPQQALTQAPEFSKRVQCPGLARSVALESAPAGAAAQPQRAGARPRLRYWKYACMAQVAYARQAHHRELAEWLSVTAGTPELVLQSRLPAVFHIMNS